MLITELHLQGFRNYKDETARFEEGLNIIKGSNAQGKTNLIEAIFFLAARRSFRGGSDKELISFDSQSACIRAGVISSGRDMTLETRLFRGRRRAFFCNGVKQTGSEHIGRLSAVHFTPDDLELIKDGAAVRRKLLDHSISQLRPAYLAALSEYGRLYENKLRILRDHREKPSLLELLDDFNLRLCQHSARLIYYRSAFTEALSRKATEIHSLFSGNTEVLTVLYKTVGGMDAAGKTQSEILPFLIDHQKQHRTAELRSGLCLSGAHKDDLEIIINGCPARKFASQGQMRTAAISIKLAQRDIHFDDCGEYPVLLLDDVLSELDETRKNFVLGRIDSGQVFITCCDDSAALPAAGRVLTVSGGRIAADNR